MKTKSKNKKTKRARVLVPFNTGTRVHKNKKAYSRKDKKINTQDY